MGKRIIAALIFGGLVFFGVFFEIFGTAEQFVEDVLCHRPDGVNNRIRIIAIDEKTFAELGEYSDWDRSIYAQVVEMLTVSDNIKPAVIGFDILFGDGGDTEADMRFAEACRRHGNVVCAFSYVFSKELTTDGKGELVMDTLHVSQRVLPYKALYDVTSHGFANALMDKNDGVIRSSILQFNDDGTVEYALNAAIYNAYMLAVGDTPKYPDTNDAGVYSFRYSGRIGEYETVSLCDVINGRVPPQAFADCIVLVGVEAKGMLDSYSVPINRGSQMYGVEIHANTIQALLEGKFVKNASRMVTASVSFVVAAVAAFLCVALSVMQTWIVCGTVAVIKIISAPILFSFGISADILSLPVGMTALGVFCTGMHYYNARRSRLEIEQAFKKYVAPQVVSEIAKNGNYVVRLGGERRDIAVLFVDIRGFTPLSESLEPEQVVEILNTYLEHTTASIFKHGGTLDKFIGDATMAVFNAPFDLEDYVFKAVLTAWDIVKGGEAIEKECMEKFGKKVSFGVGVNCGPAIVGNIGSDFRMDYTAIGDTVNTAARLEANAPGGSVYISSGIYEKVKERIDAADVGEIPLKGKAKGVYVYLVTNVKEG